MVVRQAHAVVREAPEVRGAHDGAVVGLEVDVGVAEVVGDDEEDVGAR